MNKVRKQALAALSEDAQYFGRGMFWMMGTHGCMRFFNEDTKATERTQKALDELTQAGFLRMEPINNGKGQMYTPVEAFDPATAAMHKKIGRGWFITEKITK